MKRKSWLIPLAAFAAGILMAGLVTYLNLGRALDPATPAQAQSMTQNQVMLLSSDNFFATTSAGGDKVYLWYFDREGKKSDSQLQFVMQGSTAGPMMH